MIVHALKTRKQAKDMAVMHSPLTTLACFLVIRRTSEITVATSARADWKMLTYCQNPLIKSFSSSDGMTDVIP